MNHCTVKRKLLIIRLVIESMYRSSSCTSVINSNDGSRCKNSICKTRVQLRTHACWLCRVHSWYGHVVETINADTGMQVYMYGKGEGDSVNYSSFWFPYPLGGPPGSISDSSSLPFQPHASQKWYDEYDAYDRIFFSIIKFTSSTYIVGIEIFRILLW